MSVVKYKSSDGTTKSLPSLKVNGFKNLDNKFLIDCQNCVIKETGKSKDLLEYIHINVDANQIDGKIFNYIENQRGEIVSYDTTFDFYVKSDEYLEAVFSDSEVEKKSIVFLQGRGYSVIPNSMIKLYLGTKILDEEEPSKYGFLISKASEISDDEMIYTNSSLIKSEKALTSRSTFVTYELKFGASVWAGHYRVKIRPYVKTLKDGVENIIYGNSIKVQL